MAFALEPAPQFRARVVEHLVDRAAGRAQLVGDHVDLDLVHRHRDENLALPRRQLLGDRVAQSAEKLRGFDARLRSARALGESIPGRVVVGGRDAAPAPRVSPQFYRDLEDRECVRPGREAAGAAVPSSLAVTATTASSAAWRQRSSRSTPTISG
jgi:hypothetical protein